MGIEFLLPVVLTTLALSYYRAAVNVRSGWKRIRIWSFVSGLSLFGLALSPPLESMSVSDFRVHVLQHLSIGSLAPLCIVFAAPVTLALKSLPIAHARRLYRLLTSPFGRVVSHPVTALVLHSGGMYVLYLTPLYQITVTDPTGHILVHAHLFGAGYLFAWSIIGQDRVPGRPSFQVRFGVLVAAMGLHATFSKLLFAYSFPRDVFFEPDQIQAAARIMYYGGDVVEIWMACLLFLSWLGPERVTINSSDVPAQ